jgi:cbb3-type cytochrome oxidase subunit 3
MLQEYFHGSEWLTLPLFTLVFFFGWFMVVLWRVAFRMRDKTRVDALAALPFTDDERRDAHSESHHG